MASLLGDYSCFSYIASRSRAYKKNRYWLLLLFGSMLLSLESNFTVLEYLVQIPGFSQLHVPPRALFLSAFTASILVGYGWDALKKLLLEKKVFALNISLFAFVIFLSGLTIAILFAGYKSYLSLVFVSVVILMFWAANLAHCRKEFSIRHFFAISLFLIALDLTVMGRSLIKF
jgi:hypothetical protein